MDNLLTILPDLAGTFAFAISGIKLASGKQIDWFGAYMVGLVTAIGGGTLRDLLLDVPPFWMLHSKYLITTGVALFAYIIFNRAISRWWNAVLVFDAIGLGLFTITGITKSLNADLPFWVCIVMGTITGSIGGVIRDVLLNEVPLILKRDIYALACVTGGLIYFICLEVNVPPDITKLIAGLTVIAVRLMAIRFKIHLPLLQGKNATERK